MNIIVAISGTTGVIYGIRLLEILNKTEHKTHLIISPWGAKIIGLETDYSVSQIKVLANYNYNYNDLMASLASGSNIIDGMVVVPCSMKTLSAIAHGYADNLITRAADVTLKERRKLVIVPRETPLHSIHLKNMTILTRSGGVILPPMPAFYHKPKSIDDVVIQTVGKILDQLSIKNNLFDKWQDGETER